MAVSAALLESLYQALPPRPTLVGRVNGLCVRPGPDLREERTTVVFDPEHGALGDRWKEKTWLYLPDGRPDPRVQVALCNSDLLRMIQAATGVKHHPGDTIFTDLELSEENLPAGSRLQVGRAVLEVSDVENDACAKFASHYGAAVLEWIRRPENRARRLRGLFARVVEGGSVDLGETIQKLSGTGAGPVSKE